MLVTGARNFIHIQFDGGQFSCHRRMAVAVWQNTSALLGIRRASYRAGGLEVAEGSLLHVNFFENRFAFGGYFSLETYGLCLSQTEGGPTTEGRIHPDGETAFHHTGRQRVNMQTKSTQNQIIELNGICYHCTRTLSWIPRRSCSLVCPHA